MLPLADGTDAVVNLYTKHGWLTDYQSFTSQKPAVAFIQAFEDCELAVLEINALHELVRYSPIFFKAGRLLEMIALMAVIPIKSGFFLSDLMGFRIFVLGFVLWTVVIIIFLRKKVV